MKRKALSVVCFAIAAFFLGMYIYSLDAFWQLVRLYGSRDLMPVMIFSLSAIAFFALLGWAVVRCGKEITKNTMMRLQRNEQEE